MSTLKSLGEFAQAVAFGDPDGKMAERVARWAHRWADRVAGPDPQILQLTRKYNELCEAGIQALASNREVRVLAARLRMVQRFIDQGGLRRGPIRLVQIVDGTEEIPADIRREFGL